MKYADLLWALDVLYKYYPRYHANDLLVLADDVWKWINNELPDDSSTLIYLKSCFRSPQDALKAVMNEVQFMAGPYLNFN